MKTPDYIFHNHGSLFMVEPTTDEARKHLEYHTDDEAQWMGGMLAVDLRYAVGLAEALEAAGFTTNRVSK